LRGCEIDGPFAQHYQKMMNAHRGAFFDAHALKPWADGSEAVCAKSVDGVKTHRLNFPRSTQLMTDETATAVFVDGEERAVFLVI
jgi:hypothetical protein